MSTTSKPVHCITMTTHSPEETMALGKAIGEYLGPGQVIALFGSLGSGKTTLVKGIALGMGVDPKVVRSASFLLMQEYRGRLPIYHFDAYRMESAADMFQLGCDECFWGEGVSIVEWADRVEESLPDEYIKISCFIEDPTSRRIEVSCVGEKHRGVLKNLLAKREV